MPTKKVSTAPVENSEHGLSLAQRQTSVAIQKAEAVVILDQASYDSASDLLGAIKSVQKFVKQQSAKVLEPLRESKRQAQLAMDAENERWAPVLESSAAAEVIVKRKMLSFINAVEEEKRKKEAKIQADLESGKIKKEETAIKKIDALPTAPTSTNSAQVKKIRRVYITDETKIPRSYFDLNMARVRVDALSGVLTEGVEVKLENDIAGFGR